MTPTAAAPGLRHKTVRYELSMPDKDFRKAIAETAVLGWFCAGVIISVETRSMYAIFERPDAPQESFQDETRND